MLVSVHPPGRFSMIVDKAGAKLVVSRVITLVGPLGGSTKLPPDGVPCGTRNWLLPVSVKLLTKFEGWPGTKNALVGPFVKLKFWLGEVGVAALLTTTM